MAGNIFQFRRNEKHNPVRLKGGRTKTIALLYGVDFQEVEVLRRGGRWEEDDALMVGCGEVRAESRREWLRITDGLLRSEEAVALALGADGAR